jgi:hypothetical protein
MAGSTPEVSLRISAQDGASDILRKIQAQLSSTSASVGTFNQKVATDGASGLGKLSAGFEHLARSALGFGRAEASIAVGAAEAFGATLPVLLGVAAAVAGVVEAFKYFTAGAKEADAAYNAFMASLRKTTPLAIIGAELDVAKDRLTDLQETAKSWAGRNDPVGMAAIQKQVDAAALSVQQLQTQYAETIKGLADHTGKVDAANKKGYEYIEQLTKQGYAINHTALEQKIFDIQMMHLPATYEKAAIAIAKLNDQLERQKGLIYGMGAYSKANEELVNRLAIPAGTPNLGDTLNQGGIPPILQGHAGEEHDSGTMRGHAGDPTYGYTPADIALIGDANSGLAALSDTMQTVHDLLPQIADGFGMVFEQLGAGGFDAAAKSFGKFIGQLAAMEGKLLILKGLGKIADGIFPPIPGYVTSGLKMVAAGAALEVFAGAIGGGAGGTSAGGASAGGTTQSTAYANQQLPSKGTLTLVLPRNAYARADHPEFQDFIAQTVALGYGRGIRYAYR